VNCGNQLGRDTLHFFTDVSFGRFALSKEFIIFVSVDPIKLVRVSSKFSSVNTCIQKNGVCQLYIERVKYQESKQIPRIQK
jgi:hypothetical protein